MKPKIALGAVPQQHGKLKDVVRDATLFSVKFVDAAAMESRHQRGQVIDTPHLSHLAYRPVGS